MSLPVRITALLVAFAAKNADPVTLRFYFDLVWQAPLIVVLFVFFAGGALFGVLALVVPLLRQRREIALLRKRIPPEEPGHPPVPDL